MAGNIRRQRGRAFLAFVFLFSLTIGIPSTLRGQAESSPANVSEGDRPLGNGSKGNGSVVEEPSKAATGHIHISPKASELGFDLNKLAAINGKMSELIDQGKVVGCSALIYRKGEEVYFGHWGFRDQRKKQPLTRETIFRIYSMSKPITSIAAMQLVEQGKLELDSPVENYLPEFRNLKVLEKKNGESAKVEPKRKMTTRDLLRHTSGLTYGFFGNTPVDQQYRSAGVLMTDVNLKSMVGKLSKIPLLHHPATQFHYSASTDVLGRVIEVASENSFDDYLKSNVFEPLHMKDTFFSVPDPKKDRFAQLYRPGRNGGLIVASPLQSLRFVNEENEFYSGGGGLCSTVDDYLSFCKMLLNQGKGQAGKAIVKPATLSQMFTNQLGNIERSPGRRFQFGLGFRAFPQGDYGWGGAAGTRFWVHPKKEMAIIFMMQVMPDQGRKFGDLFRDAAYAAMR